MNDDLCQDCQEREHNTMLACDPRTGEDLETEYSVIPSPKKKLDPEIAKTFKEMTINLDALYSGENPFEASPKMDDPDGDTVVDPEDLPF